MCGGPTIRDWKTNTDGARSIEQAIALLANNNIVLPDDVRLVLYEDLPSDTPASYLLPQRCSADTVFSWDTLLLDNKYGQVLIRVRPSMLESDEQIIAVISHELHELSLLRQYFTEHETVPAKRILSLIDYNNPSKNFHCLAWQHGDRAVLEFRRRYYDQ
jgi:hypothetical protein